MILKIICSKSNLLSFLHISNVLLYYKFIGLKVKCYISIDKEALKTRLSVLKTLAMFLNQGFYLVGIVKCYISIFVTLLSLISNVHRLKIKPTFYEHVRILKSLHGIAAQLFCEGSPSCRKSFPSWNISKTFLHSCCLRTFDILWCPCHELLRPWNVPSCRKYPPFSLLLCIHVSCLYLFYATYVYALFLHVDRGLFYKPSRFHPDKNKFLLSKRFRAILCISYKRRGEFQVLFHYFPFPPTLVVAIGISF